MKIKGRYVETTSRNLDVEVDVEEFLDTLLDDLLVNKPNGVKYIKDGYFWTYVGFGYEPECGMEQKDRALTPDELLLWNASDILKKAYIRKKYSWSGTTN